jgi:hypothetical protein
MVMNTSSATHRSKASLVTGQARAGDESIIKNEHSFRRIKGYECPTQCGVRVLLRPCLVESEIRMLVMRHRVFGT